MEVWKNVGIAKVWAERLKMYLGWMQFLMIGYLFLSEQPGSTVSIILLALVVFSFIMVFVDTLFIMPQEQRYSWERTTSFTNFRKDLYARLDRVEKLAAAKNKRRKKK